MTYDDITEGSLPIAAVQTSPDIQKFCDILLAQKILCCGSSTWTC